MLDLDQHDDDDVPLEAGINAYVQAIKGRDTAKRGQRGKIKFSNRKNQEDDGDADEMEVDEGDVAQAVKQKFQQLKGRDRPRGSGGGIKAVKMQRKGLGAGKTRDGRVSKNSPRGKGFNGNRGK
jgi:ribosomal RNA-processing protein 12